MSEHWRDRVHGRPARSELEREETVLPGGDVMGWRREHVARVWQALQCWLLLCCIAEEARDYDWDPTRAAVRDMLITGVSRARYG